MTKQHLIKGLWLGFLSWLIPFVASFFFFKPGGEMLVPYATFKSIISVIGVASGSYLLYRYFGYVTKDFLRDGLLVGISWMLINLVCDFLFLVPMAKLGPWEYLITIGISYLAIPVMAMAMGAMRETNAKNNS